MVELRNSIAAASNKLYGIEVEPELALPEEQYGDYSTNIALQLSKQTGKPPKEIAEAIVAQLKLPELANAEVAGPGFINFRLSDEAIARLMNSSPAKTMAGQEVVAEYSDPNPFKILHVGHLYTSVVGDAIANLLESAGARVHRVNFGGDVGLHVAKTMWAILQFLAGEHPEKLTAVADHVRWLTDRYIEGNEAYEKNQVAKTEIIELNKQIYQIQNNHDKSSPLAKIYWTTRQWSYDYFEQFYARIGTKFDKYYPESGTVEIGVEAVEDNMGAVFEKSDGAVVFKGDVHNLHTRVFINSEGLPTYETKDVGLILKKWQDYKFDRSIVITGNDIYEYMQVVLKAVEQFRPDLVAKTTHITHGMVKLAGGVKMSSRLGNIIAAEDVLIMAEKANEEANHQTNPDVALAAVKYSFLRQRIGSDVIFDPAESVNLQGNSGPYLQYAYVRALGIIQKSGPAPAAIKDLEAEERRLARKVGQYAEVVELAASELLPSHISTYLYELAQEFNRFYENNRVLGDDRQAVRLKLVEAYADKLKSGLKLLNIPVLERM